MSELPVLRLKPESGGGPIKVLHRNHRLPLGDEVRLEPEIVPETPTPKRTTSQMHKAKRTKLWSLRSILILCPLSGVKSQKNCGDVEMDVL